MTVYNEREIKGLLLKVDTVLIAEVIEIDGLGVSSQEPNCRLINPMEVSEDGSLKLWPSEKVTDQNIVMIHSSDILTMFDPLDKIVANYIELTK